MKVASESGRRQIAEAMRRKEPKWTQESLEASIRASKIYEEESQDSNIKFSDEGYIDGFGPKTWKKFCRRIPIRDRAFKYFCKALELDPEEIADPHRIIDWEDNFREVDNANFYGRTKELENLKRWIVQDSCRLLVLFGMGGIGKTTLAVKLEEEILDKFEYSIERSLRNSIPLGQLLDNLIGIFPDNKSVYLDPLETIDSKIYRLIDYLKKYRCFIMLDNFEDILEGSISDSKSYRPGYEDYGKLLSQIGNERHKSCLVLTSRVEPLKIEEMNHRNVRSLQLQGLSEEGGCRIFAENDISLNASELQAIVSHYGGNPLALKIVAPAIKIYLQSDVSRFLERLQQGYFPFSDIDALLKRQFDKIRDFKYKEIMYWLAIAREPISFEDLQADFLSENSKISLLINLEFLRNLSLVERTLYGLFTLQPVVMEYVTTNIVETIYKEIISQEILILKSHGLMKATAKDYVRDAQITFIIKPLIEKLFNNFVTREEVAKNLYIIVSKYRGRTCQESGYIGGNILNLVCQLNVDLRNYDFSELTIWQAYLQNKHLYNINFQNSDLTKSIFTQTFGSVLSIVFSPDGKLLAIGDSNGDIHLWKVADGQQHGICKGHTNWVMSVAFSPDSKFLISGSEDKTLKLWDVSTCEHFHTFTGHTDWVMSVAFCSDNQVVSGSADRTIKIWNIDTNGCRTFQTGTSKVWSIALSPDNLTIASTSNTDNLIKLWNISTGENFMTLEGHESWVTKVAYTRDGTTLVSSGIDRKIKLWNTSNGTCSRNLIGHTNWVSAIAITADGCKIVSSSEDYTLKIWEVNINQGQVNTSSCLKTLQGHYSRIWSVAISPDGQIIASGSDNRMLKLWDTSTGRCLRTLQGHPRWIVSIAFSLDGKNIISGNEDKSVIIWDVKTGQCKKTLRGHLSRIWSIALSPNGQIIASAGDDKVVRLWNFQSGQWLSSLKGHESLILSVAFNHNGTILASASDDNIILWDVEKRQEKIKLLGYGGRIRSVKFSPNGQFIASASEDKTIIIWDVNNQNYIKALRTNSNPLFSIAFKDDNILASAGDSGVIELWDFIEGNCFLRLPGHSRRIRSIVFSHDGTILASGGEDNIIKLWDTVSGNLLHTLEGHEDSIRELKFNHDSSRLASCSQDGKIKLWYPTSGEEIITLGLPRPYEGMDIRGNQDLIDTKKIELQDLGAIV